MGAGHFPAAASSCRMRGPVEPLTQGEAKRHPGSPGLMTISAPKGRDRRRIPNLRSVGRIRQARQGRKDLAPVRAAGEGGVRAPLQLPRVRQDPAGGLEPDSRELEKFCRRE
jgi:hypothetical protein